jgi:fermentation-respiration switch protein FrsA (DUF1100 family)
MDDRYEVRDAQYLISVLADEGLAEPDRIGATGVSYGGGISMALAALRNRTMLQDGSLVPWTSPDGTPMEIAAAVPQWPWTDLAYALLPNGHNLDYVADSPYRGPEGNAPAGVVKTTFVGALYTIGALKSNYAKPGEDPEADLTNWFTKLISGEPYDGDQEKEEILEQVDTYHSSYYINHDEQPAPLLIQSGWNDDLFPADEALRFYNRTRTQYPGDPISLFFMDDGHQRSQNKPADAAVFAARESAWFDHYLKGEGAEPSSSVETLTTTCGPPAGVLHKASGWAKIAPGEIRLDGAAAQTIVPGAGDPAAGAAFDPVTGPGACASTSAADQTGVANYRLAPATGEGFTLLGSPTIVADIETQAAEQEIAARLVDVAPGGTETLVARGLYRPAAGKVSTVFQLHPQGYRFGAGHVAKLELLPADPPYSRPANGQLPITVSNLELRLPVVEKPGALEGLVQEPAPKVLPAGYSLASEYLSPGQEGGGVAGTGPKPLLRPGSTSLAGAVTIKKGKLRVALRCKGEAPCSGTLGASARAAGKKDARRLIVVNSKYSIQPGAKKQLAVPLTKFGRKLVARLVAAKAKKLQVKVELADAGRPTALRLSKPARLR